MRRFRHNNNNATMCCTHPVAVDWAGTVVGWAAADSEEVVEVVEREEAKAAAAMVVVAAVAGSAAEASGVVGLEEAKAVEG